MFSRADGSFHTSHCLESEAPALQCRSVEKWTISGRHTCVFQSLHARPSAACSSSPVYPLRDPRRLRLLLLSGFPAPRSGPAGRPCCGNSGPNRAGCSRVPSNIGRTATRKLLSPGARVWLPLGFEQWSFGNGTFYFEVIVNSHALERKNTERFHVPLTRPR